MKNKIKVNIDAKGYKKLKKLTKGVDELTESIKKLGRAYDSFKKLHNNPDVIFTTSGKMDISLPKEKEEK